MNQIEARTYFREMGQLLRSESDRNERRRFLEQTRQEAQYQEAFVTLRQETQAKKAGTVESGVKRNRGLSIELTEKFPHLKIIHMCSRIATICDLKEREQDDHCIQMKWGSITSRIVDNYWEAIEIYPKYEGCEECLLIKAS